ncbi:MAG TPA: EamA family transporter [Acidimicrobiia bacterium]|nr:EamA family transporter [Acidimicrobiia bacterium]
MVDIGARRQAVPVERRPLIAVVVAVVLWSASSLFVRAGHSDALVFTTWRLWFALPPLAAVVMWRSRGSRGVSLRPRDVSRARWIGLMLGAGGLFVSGVATTFAAFGLTRLLDVTLIGALQPVLIIAFAVAFLGERVHRTHVTRAVVAVAGTIVVATAASRSGSWSLAGDVVAVISLVLNAAWFLYGRVLRTNFEIDPFAFMLGTLTCGALLLTPFTLLAHGSLSISGRGILFAACTMVSGTTAHVLMVWAHRYVATSVSSPLLLGEPPLVAAGAWVCFGESLSPIEIVGSAVVVGSLWGVVRSSELEHAENDVPDPAPPT